MKELLISTESDFSVISDELLFRPVRAGESSNQKFFLKNVGEYQLNIRLEGEGIINESFSLRPLEIKELIISLFAPLKDVKPITGSINLLVERLVI
jgi:hypothetical protein